VNTYLDSLDKKQKKEFVIDGREVRMQYYQDVASDRYPSEELNMLLSAFQTKWEVDFTVQHLAMILPK
jgi:hypothetical protein